MAKLRQAELEPILLPTSAQVDRLRTSLMLRSARPKPEILLVDANISQRKLIHDMLNANLFAQYGCKFYNAGTLKEAWSLYLSYGPDMVVVDKNLAGLGGHLFAQVMQVVDKEAFVVVTADAPSLSDEEDVRMSGVKGLLIKPYDLQRMQSICQPLVDKYTARKKKK